jgi:hypothetical protein
VVGPRPPGPAADDPAALLLECHARIRRFTGGLVAIADALPVIDARVVATARDCRRYFDEALPLHAEDEEQSVRPRLAGSAAIDQMVDEHVGIHAMLPPLLSDLGAIVEGGVPPGYAARATALREALLHHIDAEERDVFPGIAGLSSAVRADIVREMRARRGVGA